MLGDRDAVEIPGERVEGCPHLGASEGPAMARHGQLRLQGRQTPDRLAGRLPVRVKYIGGPWISGFWAATA